MKLENPIVLTVKQKLMLVILPLVGIVAVLLATSRYGAGLSPDSVSYISIARNLIKGVGFVSCNSSGPEVAWPPLYPVVLAFVGKMTGTDPLFFANIVNAIFYGLIVCVGGLLAIKQFPYFPAFAIAGTFAVLVSCPVFAVSTMAWSEPLFIWFVLLSLFFANKYLDKKNLTSLILLSLSVALSCLTRYIGCILILFGALSIVIFYRGSHKNRIAHLSLFIFLSIVPIGAWIIRNYVVSGTLFGVREPSKTPLLQNIYLLYEGLLRFYVPPEITNHPHAVMFVIMTICLFIGFSLGRGRQNAKASFLQNRSVVMCSFSSSLFIILYATFLIFSSTTTAYDPIDGRLLSPIYVPLTLISLLSYQLLVESYRKFLPKKVVNMLLIIGALVLFGLFLIRGIILPTISQVQRGKGYSSKSWLESGTIAYLIQHETLTSEFIIYTNDLWGTYILANLMPKLSPAKREYNSKKIAGDILTLRGAWPEEEKACLVWFNNVNRPDLFTIEELQAVANLALIARLDDGAIYFVTKKEWKE